MYESHRYDDELCVDMPVGARYSYMWLQVDQIQTGAIDRANRGCLLDSDGADGGAMSFLRKLHLKRHVRVSNLLTS